MDEIKNGLLIQELLALKAREEQVAGYWNGDESGIMEDRVHCAKEIIEKVDELVELLKELKIKNV